LFWFPLQGRIVASCGIYQTYLQDHTAGFTWPSANPHEYVMEHTRYSPFCPFCCLFGYLGLCTSRHNSLYWEHYLIHNKAITVCFLV
jgi:hypothetical protein